MNRQRVAAETSPRATPEFYARLAQIGIPKRLSPMELDQVSGRISWPVLLRSETNQSVLSELERIFVNRAARGGLTAQEFLEANNLAQVLHTNLRSQITALPPQQFMQAFRFVESLAYEATLPPA
jgi:hypothetical protein